MQIAKLLNGMDVLLGSVRQPETKKPSILKDMLNRPEGYLLQAYIEDEELIVTIRKRKPTAGALEGATENG